MNRLQREWREFWDRPPRHTQPLFILALLISDVGAAFPFGYESGAGHNAVTNVEWGLSAVFGLAAVMLLIRIIGKLPDVLSRLTLLISAGAWGTFTAYTTFFVRGDAWEFRAGFGLIFFSFTLATVTAYLIESGDLQ